MRLPYNLSRACDPIMPRSLHSRNERLGFGINHRLTLIRAGKFLHRIHGIEPQQSDEFDFITIIADKQFRAVIAFDVSRGDAWENFVVQRFFIGLRVRSFRPPVPDPRDHVSLLKLVLMLVIVLDGFVIRLGAGA